MIAVSERTDAILTYKRVKAGMLGAEDLSAREYGLLYLYYPWMLADVEAVERAERENWKGVPSEQ